MVSRRLILKTLSASGLEISSFSSFAAPMVALSNNQTSVDWLDKLKIIVCAALKYVPEAGTMLSALVSTLWPSNAPNVWDEIKEQVEAMIDEKINAAVFSLLTEKLDGLGGALKLYLKEIATGDERTMIAQFIATNTVFVSSAKEFQNPDFEWVLAPLFAIFTQLHLALLRHCVLHGKDWGWNAAAFQIIVEEAGETVQAYLQYFTKVTENATTKFRKDEPQRTGPHQTDIWNFWQSFKRKQTVLLDDFRVLVIYLDPVRHPEPTTDIPFKDVYSVAYGTADDWDDTCRRWSMSGVEAPFSRPLASFSSIDIELFNTGPRVVRVNYPVGKGPKISETNRPDRCEIIADSINGVDKYTLQIPAPRDGRKFNVEKAIVKTGSIPSVLTLVMNDGKHVSLWDRNDIRFPNASEVFVPGRMLTTLNMWSRSEFYDKNLGCIIFGFSRDVQFVPTSVMEAFYISAIVQPNTGPLYLPRAISSELQAKRLAYWRDIQSRSVATR
jgi:hypothetical protein